MTADIRGKKFHLHTNNSDFYSPIYDSSRSLIWVSEGHLGSSRVPSEGRGGPSGEPREHQGPTYQLLFTGRCLTRALSRPLKTTACHTN